MHGPTLMVHGLLSWCMAYSHAACLISMEHIILKKHHGYCCMSVIALNDFDKALLYSFIVGLDLLS